mmetsp:Transcript_19065/g.42057  ORF Transcript_19065/g.42057 Transcript_19065/m.42057 type:complete len:341 (+) Transcript_19065:2542-3564(+)
MDGHHTLMMPGGEGQTSLTLPGRIFPIILAAASVAVAAEGAHATLLPTFPPAVFANIHQRLRRHGRGDSSCTGGCGCSGCSRTCGLLDGSDAFVVPGIEVDWPLALLGPLSFIMSAAGIALTAIVAKAGFLAAFAPAVLPKVRNHMNPAGGCCHLITLPSLLGSLLQVDHIGLGWQWQGQGMPGLTTCHASRAGHSQWVKSIASTIQYEVQGLAFVVIVCRAGLTTAPHAGLPFYSEACHTFVGSTIKARQALLGVIQAVAALWLLGQAFCIQLVVWGVPALCNLVIAFGQKVVKGVAFPSMKKVECFTQGVAATCAWLTSTPHARISALVKAVLHQPQL